ncbi:MAG: PAS domain S-box protein, partial [Methanolinea sp.]
MISVLLVHDNSDLIESTRAFLERRGDVRVDVVHSGKQALERARSRKYDVIVSYHRIPDVDGIEFVADMTGIELHRELRAHNVSVPFILYAREARDALIVSDVNAAAEVRVRHGPSPPPVTELRDMIYQAVLRRKAERDQVIRADLLSAILSATPLWLSMVVNGKVEWVNTTMARALGADAPSLKGRNVADLFPGKEECARAFREFSLRVDEQGWGHAECELRKADGTLVPVHLRIRQVDPQDPSRGHVLVAEDLTEKKRLLETIREQEIRYRDFLSSAQSLIVKLDPEGAITFFNPHAQAFFGYSEAEILGKKLSETLVHPDLRKDAPDFA